MVGAGVWVRDPVSNLTRRNASGAIGNPSGTRRDPTKTVESCRKPSKPLSGMLSWLSWGGTGSRTGSRRVPTGPQVLDGSPTGPRRVPDGSPTGPRRVPTGPRRVPTGPRRVCDGFLTGPNGSRRVPNEFGWVCALPPIPLFPSLPPSSQVAYLCRSLVGRGGDLHPKSAPTIGTYIPGFRPQIQQSSPKNHGLDPSL